ncbi:hypothetical protein BC936DRAFT_149669 [Jimgerdemannia flammicorona]|uniref:Uncharacterized protein n=1 Tax=Jimgerdemannia flammicorona TaxID=994334 RepID=A0A433D0D3_9FUNG|nr:hypothetical protein BC936DRAFT_149669 [Jimgerdemannia flammicorona]RUP44296.1 hypothetical protein BC936DRAFT_149669 [Jimgerdemannia flammicorona]
MSTNYGGHGKHLPTPYDIGVLALEKLWKENGMANIFDAEIMPFLAIGAQWLATLANRFGCSYRKAMVPLPTKIDIRIDPSGDYQPQNNDNHEGQRGKGNSRSCPECKGTAALLLLPPIVKGSALTMTMMAMGTTAKTNVPIVPRVRVNFI